MSLTSILTGLDEAVALKRGELDAIRAQIAEKLAEREAVQRIGLDLESATKRIKALVKHAANFSLGDPSNRDPNTMQLRHLNLTLQGHLLEILCRLFPAEVEKVFVEDCDREGMSSRDRAERLVQLGREVDDLERQEERVARELEAAGVEIIRRPGASAHIVLGHDKELS